jgi:phosphoribosyl 1,2-cyclic phosphodiesterase
MSPVVFPVPFDQLGATIHFRDVPAEPMTCGSLELDSMPVRHPGGALAYWFAGACRGGAGGPSAHRRGLVYISDNELQPAASYSSAPSWRDDLVRFIRRSRVLIHDSMFTSDEYASHQGWGHSTYDEAVALALDADVDTLVLFHHKPERTDDEVDRQTEMCRALAARRGAKLRVIAAAEGLTLDV